MLPERRPIGIVYIRELGASQILWILEGWLSRTSTPLTQLGIDLAVRQEAFDQDVNIALEALGNLRRSLQDVTLRLFLKVPGADRDTIPGLKLLKSRYAPSFGLDKIREALSAFPVLQNFELNSSSGQGLPPSVCLSVPELSQFGLWRTSCPSLNQVSIFEVVLSERSHG
ncbi:hypothetical protein BDV93DRAFT_569857 [Ceratobasidium sp. AG-I]|nr:hypothetical protein BDV93DRAFT_569857 [Ceratobasidium sp. AG-I]